MSLCKKADETSHDKVFEMDILQQQFEEYTSFVETRLRPELQQAVKARKEVEQEIQEYEELQNQLKPLQHDDGWNNLVKQQHHSLNLGYGLVSCRVEIDEEPRMIYVMVGMGFHVEMNVDEALAFIANRIEFLQQHILSFRLEQENKIELHVKACLMILDQLNRELNNDR